MDLRFRRLIVTTRTQEVTMSNSLTAGFENGITRKLVHLSPELTSANWTLKKRDGSSVSFDTSKIRKVLYKCFHSSELKVRTQITSAEEDTIVTKIVTAVVNSIEATKKTTTDVESVQRLVIAQLWAEGLFNEAEHYQNYREQRRKQRLASPVAPDVAARVLEDQKHLPTSLAYYQFMSKFSRWNYELKRRETWKEAVHDRVMPWFKRIPRAVGKLSEAEWSELTSYMYNLKASPAMRVIQMAGPALDRCNVGVYNCAYQPISDLFSFSEMLYILMQGTGEGFSCESEYVDELPRIKKHKGKKPDTLIVEDSTESWCSTYHEYLQRLWDGHDVNVDTSLVRKKGSRLKTKGGRSSGPEPFIELLAFAKTMVASRQGRYIDDIDAHDLSCMTGKIVQVGGVRRAAEISLSDLSSTKMRTAKSGNWWEASRHRSMANNSAVYDYPEGVPVELFMEEWLSLVKSKSGERGIFNRRAAQKHRPKRRRLAKFGCNPCAEIILRPYEFCNLTMVIARPDDTPETLKKKVRIATIFGKLQSLCTDFKYIRKDWHDNCEEEMLLGVDITGHADCPILRVGAPGRAALLRELNKVVQDTDVEFSARFGVPVSAANTTVKPGGDSAVFFDCASGVSPWFSAYQIRWVRESINSPVAQFLIDSGVPHAPAPEAPESLYVFGFPRKAPVGATLRNDMSAEVQFFNWLEWKQNWAEHSVSATIYVEEHEWPKLGGLVYDHIDHITGLSFLPKDNGTYTYAPNEELTEEKYNKFVETFPDLNWAKLGEYESEDMTEGSQTFACVGDKCI